MGQANVNRDKMDIQSLIRDSKEAQTRIRVTALQNAFELITTHINRKIELKEDVSVTVEKELPKLYKFMEEMWTDAMLREDTKVVPVEVIASA